jgi:hypothetical protein
MGSGSHLVILNFAKGTHPSTEQRAARSPIHCALEGFQAIDLAFGLAIAPWLDHGVADGVYVDRQHGAIWPRTSSRPSTWRRSGTLTATLAGAITAGGVDEDRSRGPAMTPPATRPSPIREAA